MKYFIFLLFYLHPSCFAELDTIWWKHTVIYEIIPYTFKDSDGDGIGDLKGITSKLDHLDDIGIETIELTPMWETAFYDFGYDVADYYNIDSRLGKMEDFDELIREMCKRGMKLMLDLIINHSSHKNEWFLKSIDRIDPYTDYYVWKDAKGFDEFGKPIPPNRWRAFFGGTAWEWNEKRKQFYYHQFLEQQPDFDLRNEALKEELKKMITFWMEKGVVGFRLDAVLGFFEDKDLRDDSHERQMVLPEMFEYIHELRLFLDDYSQKRGDYERILVPEVHAYPQLSLQFYDRKDYKITQFPYYYQLEHVFEEITALQLDTLVGSWLKELPEGASTAWMTGDHDTSRVGSRIRPEYSDLFTMITMMLPGTVGCYYGQEIAMLDGFLQPDQMKDYSGKGSRDPNRLLMQWDDSINAGFSTNTTSTFQPVSPEYFKRNVDAQKREIISHYYLFKDLTTLRKTDTSKYGDTKTYVPSKVLYVFTRSYNDHIFLVVVNFSTLLVPIKLEEIVPNLPPQLSVAAASVNSHHQKGFKFDLEFSNKFIMRPMSCMVLEGHSTDE